MEYAVEIITWLDHAHNKGDDRWSKGELIDEATREYSITTIGFIIAETEVQVIQASEIVLTDQYRCWWKIRKALIVSRQVLVPKE